ncbi:hypothetical protein CR513_11181, partial [Mucuna pruriens]
MNMVANSLSSRHALIAMLEIKMLGLDYIKEMHEKDLDLSEPFAMCVYLAFHDFPHVRKDVHNICGRYLTFKLAKSKVSPHGLYTSLPIPTIPLIDISMDFILGFPRSKGGRDSIFVVIDRFSEMAYCMRSLLSRLGTNILFSTTCHPQMDGQTESSRDREDWISHVEFAYNKVFNFTTYSPFELAYSFNPFFPLNLFTLPILPNNVNDEGLSKAQFFNRLNDKARLWKRKEKSM